MKRLLDITVLTFGHLVPPFPALWIVCWLIVPVLIRIDSRGPVFYSEKRMGRGGKIIEVKKFRTMEYNSADFGPSRTTTNDQRITRFGKYLRKSGLDELPQILSIMRGDMSFVGPRALNLEDHAADSALIPGFDRRLAVKPGLTGLAQLRNTKDDQESRFQHDLQYIENQSLLLDVKIIFKSILRTCIGGWDLRR